MNRPAQAEIIFPFLLPWASQETFFKPETVSIGPLKVMKWQSASMGISMTPTTKAAIARGIGKLPVIDAVNLQVSTKLKSVFTRFKEMNRFKFTISVEQVIQGTYIL